MLIINYDLTLALLTILLIIIAFIVLLWLLTSHYKIKASKKNIIISFISGIILTAITSLLISFKYAVGDGFARKFGWPHYFFIKWYDSNEALTSSGWYVGPLLGYVLGNIIFFTALILLIILLVAKIQNRNRRSYCR